MPINCKLNRNIILADESSEQSSCEAKALISGGIIGRIYLYNFEEISNLIYQNDNRYDDNLYVDTIVTNQPYYLIDGTSVNYSEKESNGVFSHSLSISISNINYEYEDLLNDAKNGKYLVCFRPKGDEVFRMFGITYGAKMTYSLDVSDSEGKYQVTFSSEDIKPLLAVDKSNFNLRNKVFEPIFKPLYDIYTCETVDGNQNGYLIASYVGKVNAANQPLDSNNKLCEYSGKKQDAYKLNTIASDGGFNILGTYTSTAQFDGKPVKIYDAKTCTRQGEGSISTSVFFLALGHNLSEGNQNSVSFTLTSTNAWELVNNPTSVNVLPISGTSGTTTIAVTPNSTSDYDELIFKNLATDETAVVTSRVYYPFVSAKEIYFDKNSKSVSIIFEDENNVSYSAKTSSNLSVSKTDENEYTINLINRPTNDLNIENYLTFYFDDDSSKKVYVNVQIQGQNSTANWVLLEERCALDSQGMKNGYLERTLTDTNRDSVTYGQTKKETIKSDKCEVGEPQYTKVNEYCATDENGANNGQLISVWQDTNPTSLTYLSSYTTSVESSTCTKPSTEPHWVQDESKTNYCEQEDFKGEKVNSGTLIRFEIDENEYSSTAGYTRQVEVLDETVCPRPTENPNWVEANVECILIDGEPNGQAKVLYQDQNRFSPTYLSFSSTTEERETCGAEPSKEYVFSANTPSIHFTSASGRSEVLIISTVNENFIDYDVVEIADWVNYEKVENPSRIAFTVNQNIDGERTTIVRLRQKESGNEISIIIEQEYYCIGWGIFTQAQYFNLGWVSNLNMSFEIELSSSVMSSHIFGARETINSNNCGGLVGDNAGYIVTYGGTSLSNTVVLANSSQMTVGDFVKIHWNAERYSVNNLSKGTSYAGQISRTTDPTHELVNFLGATNNGNEAVTLFGGRIKYLKVWQGEELIHHYYFDKTSNGVTKLFDNVTHESLSPIEGQITLDKSDCGEPIPPTPPTEHDATEYFTSINLHNYCNGQGLVHINNTNPHYVSGGGNYDVDMKEIKLVYNDDPSIVRGSILSVTFNRNDWSASSNPSVKVNLPTKSGVSFEIVPTINQNINISSTSMSITATASNKSAFCQYHGSIRFADGYAFELHFIFL